jgi:hypothetical protein
MVGGGEFDRLLRREFAGIVDAVGEQHEHALVLRTVAQAFDGESDGVADCRLAAGETNRRFDELLADGLEVERERHEQVGARTEQDETDAVALAAMHEVARYRLDRGEARRRIAAELHVLDAHAARGVDREQQVAA